MIGSCSRCRVDGQSLRFASKAEFDEHSRRHPTHGFAAPSEPSDPPAT